LAKTLKDKQPLTAQQAARFYRQMAKLNRLKKDLEALKNESRGSKPAWIKLAKSALNQLEANMPKLEPTVPNML